jgi:carboxyl-terminal processing protease
MKKSVTVIVALLLAVSSALAASIVGVGLELYRANDKSPVKVKQVLPGSPASKAGIKPEFSIISIDGADTADMSISNCAQLIRGAPDTQVILGVVNPVANQTNMITLKRATIQYRDSSQ